MPNKGGCILVQTAVKNEYWPSSGQTRYLLKLCMKEQNISHRALTSNKEAWCGVSTSFTQLITYLPEIFKKGREEDNAVNETTKTDHANLAEVSIRQYT